MRVSVYWQRLCLPRRRLLPVAEATAARLENLLEFLASMPDDKVRVAVDQGNIRGSLFAVGDWFVAEAVVPYSGGGYVQTIFTRHAPTVLKLTRGFDRRLNDLLEVSQRKGQSSKAVAIATIEQILATRNTT